LALWKDTQGFFLEMVTAGWDMYHLQAKPIAVICLLVLANSSYHKKY